MLVHLKKKLTIFKNASDLPEFLGNENDSIGFNLKLYRCIDLILIHIAI